MKKFIVIILPVTEKNSTVEDWYNNILFGKKIHELSLDILQHRYPVYMSTDDNKSSKKFGRGWHMNGKLIAGDQSVQEKICRKVGMV